MNSISAANFDVGKIFTHIPIPHGGYQCLRSIGECRGIPFEYFMIHRPNEMVANVIDEGKKISSHRDEQWIWTGGEILVQFHPIAEIGDVA